MASKKIYRPRDLVRVLWGETPAVHHFTDNLPLIQCMSRGKMDEEPSLDGALKFTVQNFVGVGAKWHWCSTHVMKADSQTKFVKR